MLVWSHSHWYCWSSSSVQWFQIPSHLHRSFHSLTGSYSYSRYLHRNSRLRFRLTMDISLWCSFHRHNGSWYAVRILAFSTADSSSRYQMDPDSIISSLCKRDGRTLPPTTQISSQNISRHFNMVRTFTANTSWNSQNLQIWYWLHFCSTRLRYNPSPTRLVLRIISRYLSARHNKLFISPSICYATASSSFFSPSND